MHIIAGVPPAKFCGQGGSKVHVLKLAKIVELKRKSSHPKDQRALPVLEATLDELASRKKEP